MSCRPLVNIKKKNGYLREADLYYSTLYYSILSLRWATYEQYIHIKNDILLKLFFNEARVSL